MVPGPPLKNGFFGTPFDEAISSAAPVYVFVQSLRVPLGIGQHEEGLQLVQHLDGFGGLSVHIPTTPEVGKVKN